MGYKITLPLALQWMLKLGNFWAVNQFGFIQNIMFVLQIMLAFGLAFQLPIILIILGKMGFIGDFLRKKRRHVIIILLIFSMLLTHCQISYTASASHTINFIV